MHSISISILFKRNSVGVRMMCVLMEIEEVERKKSREKKIIKKYCIESQFDECGRTGLCVSERARAYIQSEPRISGAIVLYARLPHQTPKVSYFKVKSSP